MPHKYKTIDIPGQGAIDFPADMSDEDISRVIREQFSTEDDFQGWYGNWAQKAGINPDPDAPEQKYDYRAAFKAGVEPTISDADGLYHWPSEFKAPDHPNRFVEGVDTITGELQPRSQSIANPDGTRSSERSITINVEEINGGRPTNIPTIFGGKQLSEEEAIQRIIKSGGFDPETGRQLQSYNTIEEAVQAAGERSDALGRLEPEQPQPYTLGGEIPPNVIPIPDPEVRAPRAPRGSSLPFAGAWDPQPMADEPQRWQAPEPPATAELRRTPLAEGIPLPPDVTTPPSTPEEIELGYARAVQNEDDVDALTEGIKQRIEKIDVFEALRNIATPTGIGRRLPFVGGFTELVESVDLLLAAQRVEAGTATESQWQTLIDFDSAQKERELRGTTWMADVVEMASYIPGFAVEFIATSGLYYATKKITMEGIQALLKNATRKAVARLAARTASIAAGGAVQSVVVGLTSGRILKQAAERQTPDFVREGDNLFFLDDGDEFLPALAKSVGDNFIEIMSERSGGVLSRLPGAAKIQALKQAVAARWLKLHPGKTADDLFTILRSKAGWHGPVGEIFEERVAEEARRVTGLGEGQPTVAGQFLTGQGLKAWRQLLTEAAAFSIPGAGVAAFRRMSGGQKGEPPVVPSTDVKKIGEAAGLTKENMVWLEVDAGDGISLQKFEDLLSGIIGEQFQLGLVDSRWAATLAIEKILESDPTEAPPAKEGKLTEADAAARRAVKEDQLLDLMAEPAPEGYKAVAVPGTGQVDFPEGMSDAEILAAEEALASLQEPTSKWEPLEGIGEFETSTRDKHMAYNPFKKMWQPTPARTALHQKVIEAQLEGFESQESPTLYVLGGGTASGKSGQGEKIIEKDPSFVNLDPDITKLAIPEYEGLKETDPKWAATRVHDESSWLTKEMLDQAIEQKLNIVWDSSTSKSGRADQLKWAKERGYKVAGIFTDIPLEEAIIRMEWRRDHSSTPEDRDREVPVDRMEKAHYGAAKNFFELQPYFTHLELWDNSGPRGSKPTLIYKKTPEGGEIVYNEARYEEYKKKSKRQPKGAVGSAKGVDGVHGRKPDGAAPDTGTDSRAPAALQAPDRAEGAGQPAASIVVPRSQIITRPEVMQPRRGINPRQLASLTEDIGKHGILEPLVVYPEGDKYVLMHGHTRLGAADANNITDIPVKIFEGTYDEAIQSARRSNSAVAQLTPIEDAAAFKAELDEGRSIQEIADTYGGITTTKVKNRLALGHLSSALQERVQDGTFSLGLAQELGKAVERYGMNDSLQDEMFSQFILNQHMAPPQLKRLLDRAAPEAMKQIEMGLGFKVDRGFADVIREIENATGKKKRAQNQLKGIGKFIKENPGEATAAMRQSAIDAEEKIKKYQADIDKANLSLGRGYRPKALPKIPPKPKPERVEPGPGEVIVPDVAQKKVQTPEARAQMEQSLNDIVTPKPEKVEPGAIIPEIVSDEVSPAKPKEIDHPAVAYLKDKVDDVKRYEPTNYRRIDAFQKMADQLEAGEQVTGTMPVVVPDGTRFAWKMPGAEEPTAILETRNQDFTGRYMPITVVEKLAGWESDTFLRGRLENGKTSLSGADWAYLYLPKALPKLPAPPAEVAPGAPVRFSDETVSVGDEVGGLTVRAESDIETVPNQSSIAASVPNAEILPGIREVPMSQFTGLGAKHYSVEGDKAIESLMAEIKASGEITPLIVVQDSKGLYILEGATRADALARLGVDRFPALVVRDMDALAPQAIREAGAGVKDVVGPPAPPIPPDRPKSVKEWEDSNQAWQDGKKAQLEWFRETHGEVGFQAPRTFLPDGSIEGKERFMILSKSAKIPGKWQVTNFDELGPSGDTMYDSWDQAMENIQDNYHEIDLTKVTTGAMEAKAGPTVPKFAEPEGRLWGQDIEAPKPEKVEPSEKIQQKEIAGAEEFVEDSRLADDKAKLAMLRSAKPDISTPQGQKQMKEFAKRERALLKSIADRELELRGGPPEQGGMFEQPSEKPAPTTDAEVRVQSSDAKHMVDQFVQLYSDKTFGVAGTKQGELEAAYWKQLQKDGKLYTEIDIPRSIKLAKDHSCKMKECYYNAQTVSMFYKDLVYVEGQASTSIMPTGHGWLVDKNGVVVDPTWAVTGALTEEGFKPDYFGVVIPPKIFSKVMRKEKVARPVLPDHFRALEQEAAKKKMDEGPPDMNTLYSNPLIPAMRFWEYKIGRPLWEKGVHLVTKASPEMAGRGLATRLAMEAVHATRRGLVVRYGQPEAFIEADKARELAISKGVKLAEEVGKGLTRTEGRALTPLEQQSLGRLIKGEATEADVRKMYDHKAWFEAVEAAKMARVELDSLGGEAVVQGLLKNETFFKNYGRYMPRLYRKWEVDYEKLRSDYAISRKPTRLEMSRFKKRKDIPEHVRMLMGEILEPGYPVAKGLSQLRHDVETMKLFNFVADNPEWVIDPEKPLFSQGKNWNDYTKMPDTKRLGRLSGGYVLKPIAEHLNQMVRARSDMSKIGELLVSEWKFMKVITNPSTHGRNMYSNGMMAYLKGLMPTRLDIYGKSLWEIVQASWGKGESLDYKNAKEEGLFRATFAQGELDLHLDSWARSTGNWYDRIAAMGKDLEAAGAVDRLQKLRPSRTRPGQLAGKLYQAEESWFKFAMYKFGIEKGMSPKEAVELAHETLFDYTEVPPLIAWARKSPIGAPFITFTYKALPAVAKSAVQTPWRIMALVAGIYALQEIAQQQLGLDDDEMKEINRVKPSWMKGEFLGPKHLLLPWEDKYGQLQFLDLTYILPWGDVGETGATGIPRMLPVIGSPISPFIDVMWNKSIFTGREIYKTDGHGTVIDSPKVVTEKISQYLYRAMAPALAPGGYSYSKLIGAALGKKDYAGRLRSLPAAVGSSFFGLKVQPFNIDEETQWRSYEYGQSQRAISSAMSSTQRDQSLTDEEREDKLEMLRGQREKVVERYQGGF